MATRRLISFDWALKKLLRSKANFEILEGFLSELLKAPITVVEILESESNKESADDKFNRVDMKVRNAQNEIILIEVQFDQELDYLLRVLFGSAKAITEHLKEGGKYTEVLKVISIHILYFDLGQGQDYVYRGRTEFKGIHYHDDLQLNANQRLVFPHRQKASELFPEYYLIKVNQFDDVAKDTLDEWIYFLKNEEIQDHFQAQGLKQAKDKLDVMKLPEAERQAYERYLESLRFQKSVIDSSYGVGKLEGHAEGHAEGLEAGKKQGGDERAKEIALALKQQGMSAESIAQVTGLSLNEVRSLDHNTSGSVV